MNDPIFGQIVGFGVGGCSGRTKRRGRERFCAQRAILSTKDGRWWCYYHNPKDPRKFGQPHEARR